ncbi:MAG: hypothetical protein ACOCTT_00520 [archaeon]
MRENDLIKENGEESEYTLVINKALEEMALFVNGDTYPLKPNLGIKREINVEID